MSSRFYVWSDINRASTPAEVIEKYAKLRDRGIGGVFLGGGISDADFEAVKAAGLELHSWMWTTNRGESWIRENHPEWFMVSRTGKSCFDSPPYVDYYRWISPARREVQDYLAEKARELAVHPLIDGVHLDYVRYPDVILPKGLWAKYGLDQTSELPDFDFCYSSATREAFKAATGRDPADIEDPSNDQEWLHFRYDTVTNLVRRLRSVVDESGKQLTAAVFPTPSMARKICRQDWDKWPLHAVCPMIYHSFYEESVDWIGRAVREDIQAVRFPIICGLYMPAFETPDEFDRAISISFENGAKAVSLFGGIADQYWDVLKRHIN